MSHWPLSAIQGETTHRELLNNALTVCGVQRGASLLGRAMNHPACQFAACLKVKLLSLVCMRCSSLLHRNGNAKRRQDSSVDLSGAVLVWIRSSRMGLCWHQDMRWPQSRSGKWLVETVTWTETIVRDTEEETFLLCFHTGWCSLHVHLIRLALLS